VRQAGFGSTWWHLASIAAVTAIMYVSVLIAVRVAGRRTLAQLSAFDVVVSIALGTILGSTVVSPSISYSEGLAAVLTLLVLQVGLGAARRSSPRLRRLLDFRPIAVADGGRARLPGGWLGPQLTDEDLYSQLRLRGIFDPTVAERAVLEPIGGVSATTDAASQAENRSTRQVLEFHVECRKRGDLDVDLRENYAPDVVVLSAEGAHRGHEGVRMIAGRLASYAPAHSYDHRELFVEGEVGFLRWSAYPGGVTAHDGAESYLVRGGRIVAQTIHCSTSE
jgi:uncharacterized membrane protein YcaP (DUF421 family)